MNKVIYDRHAEEWDKVLQDEDRQKIGDSWITEEHTLDKWRHQQMYDLLKPLVTHNHRSWLTIGDGRYGSDARALMDMGAKDVHCTDISDTLLKVAKEKGIIKDFSEQNAESTTFKDNQFDFVLCKEAYHHFPRPQIALHEMLRVSKIGIILIEPRDMEIDRAPFYILIKLAKWLLGKSRKSKHRFETVGNYVFTVSEKELEKCQLAMHRRFVAFSGINDVYKEGGEYININSKIKSERRIINRLKRSVSFLNILCKLGIYKSNLLFSILFKSDPSPELLKVLERNGWKVSVLPKNPYLKARK